jgi:MFS transporter, NNP family, nitrate/nitrite transporter
MTSKEHPASSHGQVGWMSRLLGGEGGNELPKWSQSRPCNSNCPYPVGGELHFQLLPVLFLMFLFLLNFLPRIILAPLLVTIERELHLGHQEVGIFFLLISSGYCLTLLLSGFVSSKLSHKKCVILSTLAVGLALLWISGSSTLRGMRIGLTVLGMAAGIYIPSGIATITGLVNPKHLGKALAIHEMAPSLSFVLAPFLGEIFLRGWSWRGLLGFLGGCALITGCIFAWVGRGGDFRGEPPSFKNLKFILSKRFFWILLMLFSLAMGASVGVFTMMPLFLVSERGMHRGWANVFVALSRVLGLLAVLVAGHSVDRFGLKKTLVIFLLASGLSTVLLGGVPAGAVVLFVFLQPLLAVCFFPAGWVAIGLIGPTAIQNVSVSLIVSVAFVLGGGAVPAGIGFFGEHASFSLGFVLLGSLILLSAVLVKYLRGSDRTR